MLGTTICSALQITLFNNCLVILKFEEKIPLLFKDFLVITNKKVFPQTRNKDIGLSLVD